jgi:hypothetical protein
VVSWHDDHLGSAAEVGADRTQHRLRDLYRPPGTSLEKLEYVTEQHQPLDAVESTKEGITRHGAPQHVTAQPGAEMEVGHDERAHEGRDDATPAGGAARPTSRRAQPPSQCGAPRRRQSARGRVAAP